MKIKAQTNNKISIELTKEDMAELDITYEKLDYSNVETRRVLWTLLDEAGHKLGRNISISNQMLIEAVPDDEGGCTIYFTVADESFGRNCGNQMIRQWNPKTVCQSSSIDVIGALSKALFLSDCVAHSELYTDGKQYRLIISSRPTYSEKTQTVASEYCNICGPDTAAVTYEHWKLLASPDAVGVLSALS